MMPPASEPRVTRAMARATPGPAAAGEPQTVSKAAEPASPAPRAALFDVSNAGGRPVEGKAASPAPKAVDLQSEDTPPTPTLAPAAAPPAATPTGLGLSSMPPLTPGTDAGAARIAAPNATPMQGVPATNGKAANAIKAAISALQGTDAEDSEGDEEDDGASTYTEETDDAGQQTTLEDLLGTPLERLYPDTAARAPAPAVPSAATAAAAADVAVAAKPTVKSQVVVPDGFDPRSLNQLKRAVKERMEAAAAANAGSEEEEEEEAEPEEEAPAPKPVFNIQADATADGLASALGSLSLRGLPVPQGQHLRFDDDGGAHRVSPPRHDLRGLPGAQGKHVYFDD